MPPTPPDPSRIAERELRRLNRTLLTAMEARHRAAVQLRRADTRVREARRSLRLLLQGIAFEARGVAGVADADLERVLGELAGPTEPPTSTPGGGEP